MKRSNRLTLFCVALTLGLSLPGYAKTPKSGPENSELNSGLFYEILVGELSAQIGDAGTAYSMLLSAANKSGSAKLFERAIEVALRNRAGDSALQAAQAWSGAIPDSREANRYLLQILIGLNRLPDAVVPLKREIAAAKPDERAKVLEQIPRYFARASDKALVAKVVEQALASELKNPKTGPIAWAIIGSTRLAAGRASSALEAAQKGQALDARSREPVQLALNLLDAQLPGAEVLVAAYLANTPDNEVHMAYVRRLMDAQRYDDVKTQIQRLTTQSPDFADAWLVRGSLELQERKFAQAKSSINNYLERLKLNLASTESVGRERGLVQAYFLLAQIAEIGGNFAEALTYLDAIDTPQDNAVVQVRRASLFAKLGKINEGRALIQAIPEQRPEDGRTKLSAEVQLLRENGLFNEAYAVLSDAAKREPNDTDLAYDLAMAAEKIDRFGEAEVLLRQVIAAKPEDKNAYNALGYSLADRNLRLPEARALVTKALELAPDDAYIIDSMGWVEFRSGNKEAALHLLEKAFVAKPDAEIAAHLGEVLWSLGQQTQAQLVWQKGLQINPENETLKSTILRLTKP